MRAAPLIALAAGCTTLGPMPTTTGISAIPAGRPGGEIAASITPIFRLSDSASGDDADGNANPQLGALFDPDRLLGVPGLFVATRLWGEHGDNGLEPQLGYRHRLDDRLAILGVGYGTKMSDDENGATYKVTRIGIEGALDVKLVDLASWSSLHLQGALQATYLKSSGHYCIDEPTGNGRDCSEDQPIPMVDGKLSGVFPAGTVTLGLDLGRRVKGGFHVARLAGMFSVGWMPRVVNGMEKDGQTYITGGVSLTIGFGAAE